MNAKDLQALKEACAGINASFLPIEVVPFSNQLPDFKISTGNIYHGTTTFSALLLNDKRITSGLWLNEKCYTVANYLKHWGSYMLNSDGQIMPFSQLSALKHDPSTEFFIRPNADDKSFAGTVMPFGDIQVWYKRVKDMSNGKLHAGTEIVVGPPYRIKTEWRLWMVQGKVVAASQYRQDFRLSIKEGCPAPVRAFAEERCEEYLLDEVFVMDICETGDELYILECGSVNSAGFYAAHVRDIVNSISKLIAQKEG